MTEFNLVMSICSLIGTISTIFFAYLAFRRSEKEEDTKVVQVDTIVQSDIGYIKESIKRIESKIVKLEDDITHMKERIVKVEVTLKTLKKQND